MQKNNIAAVGQRVGLTRQEKMRKPGRKLNGREDATLDAPRRRQQRARVQRACRHVTESGRRKSSTQLPACRRTRQRVGSALTMPRGSVRTQPENSCRCASSLPLTHPREAPSATHTQTHTLCSFSTLMQTLAPNHPSARSSHVPPLSPRRVKLWV